MHTFALPYLKQEETPTLVPNEHVMVPHGANLRKAFCFYVIVFLRDLLRYISVYATHDPRTRMELLPARVLFFSERLKDSGKSARPLAL